MLLNVSLSLLLLVGASAVSPPSWPDQYIAEGVIELPYAEIKEPFTAYMDGKAKKSRIDYYESVQTIQIKGTGEAGDFGKSFKVAPMSTETVKNKKMCFLVNGTKESPVITQSILPDLTGFQMKQGTETVSGHICNVWTNVTVIGNKKNTYTLWIEQKTGYPVRYEMMGYDSLLHSHYDKYYVTYKLFQKTTMGKATFIVPKGMKCGDFPGPGAEARLSVNPMQEFIHNDDSHCNEAFDRFKKKHQKSYIHNKEHHMRKHVFRQNLRFVQAKNRASLSYSLSINHLADRTDSEMKIMRGRLHSNQYNGGQPFHKEDHDIRDIPAQMDWRLYGAVTPVKDQAICGSCWSFGTVGVMEGAYFLKTGKLLRLSQQELMDCSWGFGNNACDGGEDFRAYQWIQKHGLATEEQYGNYLGQDGYCRSDKVTGLVKISSYVNVTAFDQGALKIAIAKHGPISVGIDAAHKSLSFYSNGVYYEPQCGSKPDQLDHSVLAVGYGVMNGQAYWLIKNSWSTYWGNAGYVLMSQKDNNCGVATAPTYPVM